MGDDPVSELLLRVTSNENFVRFLLVEDTLDDWNLARDLGEFLVNLCPEDLLSHLILARAHRHLGNMIRAAAEVERCVALVATATLSEMERSALLPVLEEEKRLLLSAH